MPFDRSEAGRAALMFALGMAAVLAVMFCLSHAEARWLPQFAARSAEVQAWFKNQHNANGEWCCDDSDGHPFFGDYKINEDGSVTLETGAGPWKLPAYMVLKGPNPTGHGTRYDVTKGLPVGDKGQYVFPGEEINCRCVSRSVIPGL